MKRLILIFAILLLLPAFVSAHPGRTASDGCHYCRTNCDKWGVPWGERHCHNREFEPLPISEIKMETKKRGEGTVGVKAPGWEYGLKIIKTSPQKLNIDQYEKNSRIKLKPVQR